MEEYKINGMNVWDYIHKTNESNRIEGYIVGFFIGCVVSTMTIIIISELGFGFDLV